MTYRRCQWCQSIRGLNSRGVFRSHVTTTQGDSRFCPGSGMTPVTVSDGPGESARPTTSEKPTSRTEQS